MRCLEIRRGIIGLIVGHRDRSVVPHAAGVVWSVGQVPCPTYWAEVPGFFLHDKNFFYEESRNWPLTRKHKPHLLFGQKDVRGGKRCNNNWTVWRKCLLA